MQMRMSLLLPLLFAAVACSDDGPSDDDGDPTGDITVGNNFFNPSAFSATVGEAVVWAWADGAVTHNVTFDDGPESNDQSSGTYSRTFTAAGTYPYHCTIHGAAAMSGTVTVAASGTGGSGGNGAGGGNTGGDNY